MMLPAIVDERAHVHPSARLGSGVEIGAWTSVGAGVVLADGVKVGSHCVVEGDAVIGEGTTLSSHVVVGSPPQDLKYAGEPTRVRIGARNQLREFCTINRGTVGGGGLTEVGDENLFMTGAHVAHDCHVGHRTVFANQATLAGHVIIGDFATVGAFTAVHQFCRVGRHAFLGGFTVVTQDVLPFMRTVGARGDVKCYGPNRIGLVRKGVSEAAIDAIGKAFRVLRAPGGRTPDGMARMLEEQGDCAEVRELVLFLETARAKRGFHL